MKIIIQHIALLERIDQLARLQATGNPEELAYKLGISKTKLYRIINLMKEWDAPITYDFTKQSFVYDEAVGFRFGFFTSERYPPEINPFVG